jgi:N-methylhydantoinase A
MRYVGQGSEITVALAGELNTETVRAAFETSYRALYGRTPPGAAIQFVALRLALSAPMAGSGGRLRQERSAGAARKETRAVWFPEADGLVETAVYNRYALRTGDVVEGPAVFEETESTLVIGPGGWATVLDDGTIDVVMP